MTTINTQLLRISKALSLMDSKSHPSIVPPQLLANTKGILFFKKLPKGKQSHSNSQGVYFQRNGEAWSQPLAVQMNKGDLYWGSQPSTDRVDVMVLILDDSMSETLRCFGQLGFHSDSAQRMKKGVCVENSDASFVKFATVLSERPDLISGAAFSYGLCNGHFFPVDIESPIVQFRDSSNLKFYNYEKNLDTAGIISGTSVVKVDTEKTMMIKAAQKFIAAYFNIEQRFPDYFGGGSSNVHEATGASSPNPLAVNSPVGSPDPAADSPSPFLSMDARTPGLNPSQRQWSSSDASTGSTDDRLTTTYSGYVPNNGSYDSFSGGSLNAQMQGLKLGAGQAQSTLQPSYNKAAEAGAVRRASEFHAPQPPMQAPKSSALPSPVRERASSFDFNM